jgi:hypothetical protein
MGRYRLLEKIEDIRPTAELSSEMIKTICDAISQEFYSWELKEDDDDNLKVVLDLLS